MDVDREQFLQITDGWLRELREEALALFLRQVPPEQCIPLAIKIVEAKDVGRAQRRMQLLAPGLPIPFLPPKPA